MDTEIDLTTASRDVLIAIIVQQQAVIAELQVMMVRLSGGLPNWKARRSRTARPECPASPAQFGPPAASAAAAQKAATPRLCPPAHDTDPCNCSRLRGRKRFAVEIPCLVAPKRDYVSRCSITIGSIC